MSTFSRLESSVQIPTIQPFLVYFEGIRARTLRVVECIPPDRLEWSYSPGRFTLGDLARHIAATERWMFAENVAGRPSRYPGHSRGLADGLDAVTAYLHRMHRDALDIFAALTDEDLVRKCSTPAGTEISTWKWLRAMIEHEVHHRGQIYLILGLLGVATPPLYGLTEPQVRARSIAAPTHE
jgi:uncharacterized damage-inducible protein DinB